MSPLLLIPVFGAFFLVLERVAPGRPQAQSAGWYVRAVLLNLAQLGVVLLGGLTWAVWLHGTSAFSISALHPALQGFICWFIGTFVFLSLIHISEPTRLLSISYAVFCLKKKKE